MTRRSHPTTTGPRDRLNPGVARTQRVLDPVRSTHTKHGVFRPANEWRATSQRALGASHQPDVRNRALLLAKHLPWLPQYNFARS